MTQKRHMGIVRVGLVGALCLAVVTLALATVAAQGHASAAPTTARPTLKARFDPASILHPSASTAAGKRHAATTAAARKSDSSIETIPYWSSSFSYAGTTYPYQMVGSNPMRGSDTTVVRTVIVPIIVNFSDGTSFDGTSKVAPTKNSPLWKNAFYNSGYTQYGNALQRGEFWKYTSHKDYNVLLGTPTVLAPVTFNVPAGSGAVYTFSGVPTFGVVDINWWYPQVVNLLSADNLSARVFPIFLTDNVLLSVGDPTDLNNCCIIGYHDAISSQVGAKTLINTYAWASWTDPGIFSVAIDDVNALSHEVAEWLNDPFTDNIVPNWSVPAEPQYGCSNSLEVGDPLVGVTSYVNGYHLQDEAYYSWFSQQTPSIGINGQYSMFGTFDAAAPSC